VLPLLSPAFSRRPEGVSTQRIGPGLPSLRPWNAAAFSSRRRRPLASQKSRGAAPDGHRVKHRPLPDQQHRASSPRGRAGAPLRAARFLFRYRDAPAGMTSSSGRAAGLILRARTVSAWTPHPPHAAARLSAAASLEARFPQHTPPSRWRRGALKLACFLPSGIV